MTSKKPLTQLVRTGRTRRLEQADADAVLQLGIALGANIQSVIQEREGGQEDVEGVEEVDVENVEDETGEDWGEVEEVKLNDTLDGIPVSLDETAEDISDVIEDEEISDLTGPEKDEGIENLETGSEEGSLRWWRERVVALQKEADDVDHGEGGGSDEEEDAKVEDEGEVGDEHGEGDEAHQSAIHNMIDTFINSVRDPSRDFFKKDTNGDKDGKADQLELMHEEPVKNDGFRSARRPRRSLSKRKSLGIGRGEEAGGNQECEFGEEEEKLASESHATKSFDNPTLDNSESIDETKDAPNSAAESASCRDGQNDESLASPKSVDKKDKGSLFNCPLCIFIVEKKASLREHLSTVHYLSILLNKFCQQGLETFSTKNIVSKCVSDNLSCPLCEKIFFFKATLAKHLGTTHKKLKEITTIHSKVFPSKWKKKAKCCSRCTVPTEVVTPSWFYLVASVTNV